MTLFTFLSLPAPFPSLLETAFEAGIAFVMMIWEGSALGVCRCVGGAFLAVNRGPEGGFPLEVD